VNNQNYLEITAAIQETINYLQKSEDSIWAHRSVSDLIETLEDCMQSIAEDDTLNRETLGILFAPTGSLQEIAMANSWADEYLRLSTIIDKHSS